MASAGVVVYLMQYVGKRVEVDVWRQPMVHVRENVQQHGQVDHAACVRGLEPRDGELHITSQLVVQVLREYVGQVNTPSEQLHIALT